MDIRAEVANALHWDPAIHPHRVIADVDVGLVRCTASSTVYQNSYAEAIARRVPGMIDVRNKIAIRASVEFCQPTLHP